MMRSLSREAIRVYWIPGCSSCLRAKEFLEKTGFPFESINVLESHEAEVTLKELNLTVPSVVVGAEGVPGLDLVGIAQLIGYDYQPPAILAPEVMKDKYIAIIDALARLVNQLPPGGLDEAQSSERNRDLRTLAGHATSIMRTFLYAYDNDVFDKSLNSAPPLETIQTTDQLISRARETKVLFETWWKMLGFDDDLDHVIDTYFGSRTLLEILERQTWHTGHHVRQIAHRVELFGITPDWATMDDDLNGLPLPDRITS
jgi:glutaredoxin